MHGCARGPPPEGRWGGRSNPPLDLIYNYIDINSSIVANQSKQGAYCLT